jgi:hypothetical protein
MKVIITGATGMVGEGVLSGYGTERLRPQKDRDLAVMSTSDIAPTLAATRQGV